LALLLLMVLVLLVLLVKLLLLKRLLLVVMLLLMLLRLSCRKASKSIKIGVHHPINMGVPHILRRLMPPMAPWFPGEGRGRHGMLVEGSTLWR
jgi:hypothetical protein